MIEVHNVLTGTRTPVDDDRVEITLESGRMIRVEDLGSGIKVSSPDGGLAVHPQVRNVVTVTVGEL